MMSAGANECRRARRGARGPRSALIVLALLSACSSEPATTDDGGPNAADGGAALDISTPDVGVDADLGGASDQGPTMDAGPPSAFDVTLFTEQTALTELDYVPDDLSGITYNPDSDTFYMIRYNATRIWEVDTSYNLRRSIMPTAPFGDTEDIVYLGANEYAIVTEEGVLFIGTIPPGQSDISTNPDDWQAIRFTTDGGNSGPEGVAYDAANRVFYVVKEENPRALYRFPRPAAGVTDVTSTEPYDAQMLPMPRLTQDMSGVYFHPGTGRLLILSHRDHRIVDIALDATVFGVLDLPSAQHEGITLDGSGDLHVVGEPNRFTVYAAP